ncbi:UNVERIFIED_CONTAM: COBRA-like protein 10 [Sesamum radiatum]|uniref:COBRA-like protein 10 n=1 Tax=Sesamum radiatum TaxID=300843 RepID=A0AAW2K697_SESRA
MIRIPWDMWILIALALFCHGMIGVCSAQDYGGSAEYTPPKEAKSCNGIFISYNFQGREKTYPLVKNVSAQAWSFRALATVLNTGSTELKSWKLFVGFQYNELLVGVDGAVVLDGDPEGDGGDGFPIRVGKNGTVLTGYPQADLKTAIDTAGDFTQMQVQVTLKGTQFGVNAKATPMPKSIKLANEGYVCPKLTRKGGYMHSCCRKDPKYKPKEKITKTKFLQRQQGDLTMTYDIIQAYEASYHAQITIDNNNPLGRLDQWNLTFQWMRNEFIYSMRGAYTHIKDPAECIYGAQGQYYKDLDFSNVVNCQKYPVISDLPSEKENDDKVGKLPFCCKNGILMPKTMNETKAKAIFQMEVYKLPPDMNRTAITPPQNWHIQGRLNPTYRCGPPIRVDPTEFPDPTGLPATASAIASWQISCNITSPKPKKAKCCVSYSAFYSDGVVPCNTCACGCDEDTRCDANAAALALPSNALLVPFENRTVLAKAFAHIQHKKLPKKLPCPDNCGVSINWHIDSDYRTGWTARVTIFNWETTPFVDWFSAVRMKKPQIALEKVYTFNGTKMTLPSNTIFMQGKPGENYLMAETNSTKPQEPNIPGKQQSVIQFSKKHIPRLNVVAGEGFPSKLFFNGEECALPKEFPKQRYAHQSCGGGLASLPILFPLLLLFHDFFCR